MFGTRRYSNQQTLEILNADEEYRRALRQAERERANVEAAERDRRFLDEERARAERHQQVEQAATAAHLEQRRRQAEGQQAAQRVWAQRRDELRDQVADLRARVQQAQMVVDTGVMDEAARASGEVLVYQRRLQLAEQELDRHMREQQPRFYA